MRLEARHRGARARFLEDARADVPRLERAQRVERASRVGGGGGGVGFRLFERFLGRRLRAGRQRRRVPSSLGSGTLNAAVARPQNGQLRFHGADVVRVRVFPRVRERRVARRGPPRFALGERDGDGGGLGVVPGVVRGEEPRIPLALAIRVPVRVRGRGALHLAPHGVAERTGVTDRAVLPVKRSGAVFKRKRLAAAALPAAAAVSSLRRVAPEPGERRAQRGAVHALVPKPPRDADQVAARQRRAPREVVVLAVRVVPVARVPLLAHHRGHRRAALVHQVEAHAPASVREHELLLAVVHERHLRQRDGIGFAIPGGRRGRGTRGGHVAATPRGERSASRAVVGASANARRGFARQPLRDDPVEPLGHLAPRVRVQVAVLGEVGGVAEARAGLRTRILADRGENLHGFLLPSRVRATLGQVHLDALTDLHLAVTHEVRVFVLRACLFVVPGHQGTPPVRPISRERARINGRPSQAPLDV